VKTSTSAQWETERSVEGEGTHIGVGGVAHRREDGPAARLNREDEQEDGHRREVVRHRRWQPSERWIGKAVREAMLKQEVARAVGAHGEQHDAAADEGDK